MKAADITLLYDYNYWANRRILAAAAGVSAEQYAAPGAHSFGSLRGTLVHTLDTEYGWRILCRDGTFTADITEADLPTLPLLEARWREEEHAMRAYLAGLTDHDLAQDSVRYTTPEGARRERVLWHCLWHVVNHGMQHRAEAAAILTSYGCSPGELDFTMFLNQR